jgi:hypothetical protein
MIHNLAITGISSSPSMAQDTMAILRGHCIEFDIRRDKTIIGRSTSRHQVDVLVLYCYYQVQEY